MAKFIPYTNLNGSKAFVNMDLVINMTATTTRRLNLQTNKYEEIKCTRLESGGTAGSVDGYEDYFIEAKEGLEYFLEHLR